GRFPIRPGSGSITISGPSRHGRDESEEGRASLAGSLIDRTSVLESDAPETDLIARLELSQAVHVGGDHVRDVRITPKGTTGHSQHDELPPGHLDGARSHRGGEPFGNRGDGHGDTCEAQAHAIAARTDAKSVGEPEGVIEP